MAVSTARELTVTATGPRKGTTRTTRTTAGAEFGVLGLAPGGTGRKKGWRIGMEVGERGEVRTVMFFSVLLWRWGAAVRRRCEHSTSFSFVSQLLFPSLERKGKEKGKGKGKGNWSCWDGQPSVLLFQSVRVQFVQCVYSILQSQFTASLLNYSKYMVMTTSAPS